uniref:Uncharacterized protein n=1 Tax=Denticeps clupeoides TaxID=299321 RepID=A0AAY4E234_9TELE
MNVSLENPYGNVTIPRAKLRTDSSTVIINPLALENNPYGGDVVSGVPVYGTELDRSQVTPAYNGKATYTVTEDNEQVRRCGVCCCRRRRK